MSKTRKTPQRQIVVFTVPKAQLAYPRPLALRGPKCSPRPNTQIVGHWSSGVVKRVLPVACPWLLPLSIYLQFVKQLQEAPLCLIQVHTQNTKYKRATKKNWGAFSWLSTGSVVKDLQWAQAPQAFQCLLSLLLELLQHWGHQLRPMLAELPALPPRRNETTVVFGRTRISQVRNKPVSLYVTSSKAHLKYPKKTSKKMMLPAYLTKGAK